HSGLDAELEIVGRTQEWLVLPNRLFFVIEHRPSAADPARVDGRAVLHQRAGFGLDLLFNLAPESIPVAEAELNLGGRSGRIAEMRFAGDGGCVARTGGCRIAGKSTNIVDDARRGLPKNGRGDRLVRTCLQFSGLLCSQGVRYARPWID